MEQKNLNVGAYVQYVARNFRREVSPRARRRKKRKRKNRCAQKSVAATSMSQKNRVYLALKSIHFFHESVILLLLDHLFDYLRIMNKILLGYTFETCFVLKAHFLY
jgi:hypothetical protein